ncbi:hypothetical protein ACLOAV_008924 [Pseudogymnoascus australis]
MSTWKARKDYPTRVPRVQVSQVETWTRYIEEDPGVLEWFLQPLSEGVNWKEIRARGDTDTKALYGWAWDCLVEAAESAYQLGRDQKVDGARGGGNSAWYRANQEWEDLGKSDKCPEKKAPANLPSWDENEETAEETATATGFGDAGGDTTTMLTTAVQERIKRGKGGAKKEMTKEERAVHNAQMRRRKRRGSTAHNIIRN